ncbi:MAG: ABC transporter permease [Bacteroides sp.]|nr:ABC transporter permease [Bacteroides sp.]
MNLPVFIARRYFSSRKSPLVTVIGRVAVLGIAVSTAAMMLILSVMNGMNRFVAERFGNMDADLKIEAVKGKYFSEDGLLGRIAAERGVQAVSGVLEDQALLTYGEQTVMVQLKGVDSAFDHVSGLAAQIYSGDYDLDYNDYAAFGVMGGGVYDQLQFPPSQAEACRLYAVDGSLLDSPFAMQQAVNSFPLYPSGLFSSIPEYDNRYVFCHIGFARQMFKSEDALSAIELKVAPDFKVRNVKKALQAKLGGGFTVKDRMEQQQAMFKSMKAEKLIVIAVFAFVMLIATFTMVADQMLLMYEKRRDIAILSGMGMGRGALKGLFFCNGLLVCVWGTLSGLLLGSLLAFGQQEFGWVKLGGGSGNYITDAYPVYWQAGDLLLVLGVGLAVGMLASALPLQQVNVFAGKPAEKE